MRKWAQNKPYYERKEVLSIDEQTVFDVLILNSCNSDYLKKIGLEKYGKDSDFVNLRIIKLIDFSGTELL